jgi:Secretion system C-terminal sorting domain
MRKVLLLFLFAVTGGLIQAQSVCMPDFVYAILGITGIWPNPQQGPLPDGDINQPYSETITVVVGADTTIDLSQFGLPLGTVTVSINSLDISGVNGLPTGLSYACNNSGCSWGNSTNGCLKISGTPTQAGQFTVQVLTSLNINIPNFGPFATPAAPAPYDLTVQSPATGITDLRDLGYAIEAPAPNPASGRSVLTYTSPIATTVQLEVNDITGRLVHHTTQRAIKGENRLDLDAADWAPGLYLCSLTIDGKRLSTKLVVE